MNNKINIWKPNYSINIAIARALMDIESAKAIVENTPLLLLLRLLSLLRLLLEHGQGDLDTRHYPPLVGIRHDGLSMGYPPFPVDLPQEKKLHDVLLVAGQPVHIGLYLRQGSRIAGVVELFGKFGGMKGMKVKTLFVEAWCSCKNEMRRQGPSRMVRDEGPFRVVEPEPELLLEKPVEREAHPL